MMMITYVSPLLTHCPAALGAKVIAAAGSPSKLEVCKRYGGADYVIDYTAPNWQKEVMAITNGHGADVIYDPVGRIRGESHCTDVRNKRGVICLVRLLKMHSMERARSSCWFRGRRNREGKQTPVYLNFPNV